MHTLTLFIDQICLSRAVAPGRIKKALARVSGVHFEEKDLRTHAEDAKKSGVKMSPTLVLDGKILCVGIPGEDELGPLIRERLKHQEVRGNG